MTPHQTELFAHNVAAANRKALQKLADSDPYLVGCGLAGDVMPGFRKNLILHSGPPIKYADTRGPHRNGWVGAALFEGLAPDEVAAIAMIENGEIEIGEANNHNSGGPGAGITSASMAVLIVEERNSGIRAYAAPIEGQYGGGLGGWGMYNRDIENNLRRIGGYYAPLLDGVLKHCGGISIRNLFAQGLLMGDEEHSRQVATDKLFISKVIEAAQTAPFSEAEKFDLVCWLNSCNRFVHHIGTATAVACLKAAAGIEYSNMVTAMCGNGVEFGIKISALGEKWFTAPAPGFTGRYFSPEHTDADAAPWLGDSSNVEAYGLGGMVAAAAPVLLAQRGVDCLEAAKQTKCMYEICMGVNANYTIPALNGEAAPSGIDPAKVIQSGILPMMHGGVLSKHSGGQIGVGYAKPPLECFQKAMDDFEKRIIPEIIGVVSQ